MITGGLMLHGELATLIASPDLCVSRRFAECENAPKGRGGWGVDLFLELCKNGINAFYNWASQ